MGDPNAIKAFQDEVQFRMFREKMNGGKVEGGVYRMTKQGEKTLYLNSDQVGTGSGKGVGEGKVEGGKKGFITHENKVTFEQ